MVGFPRSPFQARMCLMNYRLVRVRGKASADTNVMKPVTQNSIDKHIPFVIPE